MYICSISHIFVHTTFKVQSVFVESKLRLVERFSDWLNTIVITVDTDASLNAPELLCAEECADSRLAFSLLAMCELHVWLCSSSVL